MKTTQRYNNIPFEIPNGKIHVLVCCDCGLAHDIVIVGRTGKPLDVATRRNERSTAQRRRAMKRRREGVFA